MVNIKKFFITRMQTGKPAFSATTNLRNVPHDLVNMLAYFCLRFLSWGYRSIVQLRVRCYRHGIFKQARLPCPVISVGNLTTGGTGKTPAVIEIARILRRRHKRIAILTRGYHRQTSVPNIVVQPDSDVHLVGDEPLLMLRTLAGQDASPGASDIAVIVGSNRYQSGQIALDQFRADVMVLDDGFQHLQLARTFDLVLIDATNPFGGNQLLPAGFLREPLPHLTRAHAFLITRSDEVQELTPIIDTLRAIAPNVPIFRAVHAYETIRELGSDTMIPPDRLASERLLAVSGLGNPDSFRRVLQQHHIQVEKHLDFPDHHWYTANDLGHICRILTEQRLAAVITTEKDEVKFLPYRQQFTKPCYVMTIRMNIQPEQMFEAALLGSLPQPSSWVADN